MTITDAGLSLLAESMTGEGLHFTKMEMGDAAYSGNLAAVTAVVSPKCELELSHMARSGDQVTFKSVLAFREVETGFTWRELGLYAQNPDGGAYILYAYGNAGEEGDYIPGETEATLNERVIQLTVAVASTPNITAELSGSGIFIEYSELEAAIEELGVVTLTHAKKGTVHKLTGLGGQTGLLMGRFKAAADFEEGDTFTIDGASYTARQENGEGLSDGQFVTGSGVAVVVDTTGKILNFKGGGGVGSADLALATATEATVFSGKTFYAGDSKELRTGTALSTVTDVAAGNLFNGKKAYDNNGNLITGTALSQAVNVTANNIPSGVTAYNQAGQRITGNGSGVFKYKSGSCFLNGSSKSISCDFHIWMVALYGGSWLSDCVLFTGTSNSGSTTFYKCPDSDFIDQENYQGTISVSGGNYATIWYNAGDGCSIYYYVVGV